MKNRLKYIDIAKGISILLVILGHCLQEGSIIRQYIYTFHMPLFFIVSGMFYKKRSFRENLRKDIKGLIIPYLITSSIIILAKTISKINNVRYLLENLKIWGMATLYGSGDIKEFLGIYIEPIGTIWFLLSLFWVRTLFNLIMKIDKEYVRILIIISISVVGFLLPKIVWLPLSIETSFIVVLFYYTGYILKQKSILNKIDKKSFIVLSIIWICSSKFIVTYCVKNYYNLYYINILIGIIGSMVVLCICKKVEKIKYVSDIFAWIGENSLYILCAHAAEGRGIIPWKKIIKSNNIVINIIKRETFPLLVTVIYKKVIRKKDEKKINS